MNMDADLYTHMKDPLLTVVQFFMGPISNILKERDEEEMIMDLGCGPGNFSTRLILHLFSNCKRIIAVDMQPSMIQNAILNYPHPCIEYSVANIDKWSTVEKWENQISKLFSIHVFHWIKDQKRSFENVWKLLKPGGYAMFFFVLHSTFFETCLELKKDPQWNEYFKDADTFVPTSHIEKYEPKYYADMLTNLGFSIEYCNFEEKTDTFKSDEMLKDFFSSICVMLHHIPVERRNEFQTCILNSLLKKNGRVEGLPVHRGRMIELIVKKT